MYLEKPIIKNTILNGKKNWSGKSRDLFEKRYPCLDDEDFLELQNKGVVITEKKDVDQKIYDQWLLDVDNEITQYRKNIKPAVLRYRLAHDDLEIVRDIKIKNNVTN